MAWATAPSGTRMATVVSPAVTKGDSPAPARSGNTSVSGPGQNACASRKASGGISTSACAAPRSARCTISGLKRGRPLASKIFATARSERASAPSP